MWRKVLVSFLLALQNIRSRLFHTLLSILGIVIGVAAPVAVLSLIDGMEQYAQEQITKTTSLKAIVIRTNTNKVVNNAWLEKDTYSYFTYHDFQKLTSSLSHPANGYIQLRQTTEVAVSGRTKPMGVAIVGKGLASYPVKEMAFGRFFTDADLANRAPVAYVNHAFAREAVGEDALQHLIGNAVAFKAKTLQVIGVLAKDAADAEPEVAEVYMPITVYTDEELMAAPPTCVIEAGDVEKVPVLKAKIEDWLPNHFKGDSTHFSVMTNEMRVEQVAKGFLLFRVVMGLIVGISVVVGGVGVMNVLLIAVSERRVEVGVRKAMGAKKFDILLQFLAESVTVSLLGSFLGLTVGVLGTMAAIPIIKALTDVPFQAAYTWNTFLLIALVAILIGIVFGTYPAMRAAQLDPVEAIRRE